MSSSTPASIAPFDPIRLKNLLEQELLYLKETNLQLNVIALSLGGIFALGVWILRKYFNWFSATVAVVVSGGLSVAFRDIKDSKKSIEINILKREVILAALKKFTESSYKPLRLKNIPNQKIQDVLTTFYQSYHTSDKDLLISQLHTQKEEICQLLIESFEKVRQETHLKVKALAAPERTAFSCIMPQRQREKEKVDAGQTLEEVIKAQKIQKTFTEVNHRLFCLKNAYIAWVCCPIIGNLPLFLRELEEIEPMIKSLSTIGISLRSFSEADRLTYLCEELKEFQKKIKTTAEEHLKIRDLNALMPDLKIFLEILSRNLIQQAEKHATLSLLTEADMSGLSHPSKALTSKSESLTPSTFYSPSFPSQASASSQSLFSLHEWSDNSPDPEGAEESKRTPKEEDEDADESSSGFLCRPSLSDSREATVFRPISHAATTLDYCAPHVPLTRHWEMTDFPLAPPRLLGLLPGEESFSNHLSRLPAPTQHLLDFYNKQYDCALTTAASLVAYKQKKKESALPLSQAAAAHTGTLRNAIAHAILLPEMASKENIERIHKAPFETSIDRRQWETYLTQMNPKKLPIDREFQRNALEHSFYQRVLWLSYFNFISPESPELPKHIGGLGMLISEIYIIGQLLGFDHHFPKQFNHMRKLRNSLWHGGEGDSKEAIHGKDLFKIKDVLRSRDFLLETFLEEAREAHNLKEGTSDAAAGSGGGAASGTSDEFSPSPSLD